MTAQKPQLLLYYACQSLSTLLLAALITLSPHTLLAADTAAFDDLLRQAEQRRVAIAESMEGSTFFIYAEGDDTGGTGTGFYVAEGYILTNGHVTEGAHTFYVAGRDFALMEATLVKEVYNDKHDFALLRFQPPVQLPVLSFNLQTRRTDRVSAWGYPYIVMRHDVKYHQFFENGEFVGLPPLVYTEGIVSSFVDDGDMRSVVHTAAIAGGNSGGPLVNAYGHVVGVNTWGSTDDDEGAFVNAAQTAQDSVDFLYACGIQPRIVNNNNTVATYTPTPTPTSPSTPMPTDTNTSQGLSLPSVIIPSGSSGTSPAPVNLNDFLGALTDGISGSVSGYIFHADNAELTSSDDLDGKMKNIFADALAGDSHAQVYIGLSYYEGDEAPVNTQKGMYWLEKAASAGNIDAKGYLGIIYVTDMEFKDTELGMQLLEEAAPHKAIFGYTFAELRTNGESLGVERDWALAEEVLQKHANGNAFNANPDAEALMAFLLFFGYDDDASMQKAFKLAENAAKKNVPLAYAVLSWMYYYGIVLPEDEAKAFEYAQKAANGNDTEGQAIVSMCYANGIGVTKNTAKALEYAQKAAEYGNEVAEEVLATLYANGDGVAQNLPLAWAYIVMSARHGYDSALELQKELHAITTREQRAEGEGYVDGWYAQWGLQR